MRHAFVTLLFLAPPAFAAGPATRAERGDLVDTKLRDLTLGDSARTLLRRSSWWAAQTVAGLITMDANTRRAAFASAPWLERELGLHLERHDLRFTLTGEELRAYVEVGRAPGLTPWSSLQAIPLTAPVRSALTAAGCRTLGDVRAKLLDAILYGVAPLTEPMARELRQLRHLPLTEGAVITADEFEFARGLAEARIGQRARRLLRDHGVRTRGDLRALPLADFAARGPLEKKCVRQVRALLHGCAPDFVR